MRCVVSLALIVFATSQLESAQAPAAGAPAPAVPSPAPAAATPAPPVAAPAATSTAPWRLILAGVDISGASSTDSKAVFLGLAGFDYALTGNSDAAGEVRQISIGGQLRIAGMAQPGTLSGNLGSLDSATTYLTTAVNATPDKIVQSVEGSLNVAVQITKPHDIAGNKAAISFVGSFGAITPLSADQANPPVYVLTNQILTEFAGQISGNNPSGCAYTTQAPTCYVAFIPQDRSHFYRHYETGLRLKFYEKLDKPDGEGNKFAFPANADLLIGQNEYVTKGKLSGLVLHFGGLVPIPKYEWIYMFGSMDTTLSGESLKEDSAQLLLSPAPSSANLTYLGPSVYTISVGQPERDRYRLGFGIDLYHLLTAKKSQ